jgi:hypothetical protein
MTFGDLSAASWRRSMVCASLVAAAGCTWARPVTYKIPPGLSASFSLAKTSGPGAPPSPPRQVVDLQHAVPLIGLVHHALPGSALAHCRSPTARAFDDSLARTARYADGMEIRRHAARPTRPTTHDGHAGKEANPSGTPSSCR